jgi:2'-phosphotransferase
MLVKVNICEKLLTKLLNPITGVFHGTYKTNLKSIQSTGLNRMKRQHIHLAKSFDAVSGQRSNCNLIVYVDMKKAMEDGIDFFESDNGVILTEGINGFLSAKYLSFVELI